VPQYASSRLKTVAGANQTRRAGRNALKNLRFASTKKNIPSPMGYNVNVSGGDLVSTWVTKPLEHAEVPISS